MMVSGSEAEKWTDSAGNQIAKNSQGKNPTRNLTQTVVQDVGVGIVTGKYDSIPFPTEMRLSAKYRASRTVIREAVKILATKGLITSRPRLGTRLTPEEAWNLSDTDVLRWLLEREVTAAVVLDFYEMLLVIMPPAAELAAQRRSLAQSSIILKTAHAIFEMERRGENSRLEQAELFLSLLEAARNPFLGHMGPTVTTALSAMSKYRDRFTETWGVTGFDFRRVALAIEAASGGEARITMSQTLRVSMSIVAEQGSSERVDGAGNT